MRRRAVISIIGLLIAAAAIFVWLEQEPTVPPRPPHEPTKKKPKIAMRGYQGRVFDVFGKPIRYVDIEAIDLPQDAVGRTRARTNGLGEFAIEHAAGHAPVVRMRATRYIVETFELEDIDREADTGEAEYTLFVGGTLNAQIVDKTGQPVAGASVLVAGRNHWFDELESDSDGRFLTTGPPGPIVLEIHSDAYADQRLLDAALEFDRVSEQRFVLDTGATLEVTVHAGDQSAYGAEVRLTGTGDNVERATARCDLLGKATLTGLSGGDAELRVALPNWAEHTSQVNLPFGAFTERQNVELTPAIPWRLEISGLPGDELPSVELELRRSQTLAKATFAEFERLQLTAPGRSYVLAIRAKDRPRQLLRFRTPESGTATVSATIESGGRVRGRIFDKAGALPGIRLLLTRTGLKRGAKRFGADSILRTLRNGGFESPLVVPGSYRLVSASREHELDRQFEITADAVLDLGDITVLPND